MKKLQLPGIIPGGIFRRTRSGPAGPGPGVSTDGAGSRPAFAFGPENRGPSSSIRKWARIVQDYLLVPGYFEGSAALIPDRARRNRTRPAEGADSSENKNVQDRADKIRNNFLRLKERTLWGGGSGPGPLSIKTDAARGGRAGKNFKAEKS